MSYHSKSDLYTHEAAWDKLNPVLLINYLKKPCSSIFKSCLDYVNRVQGKDILELSNDKRFIRINNLEELEVTEKKTISILVELIDMYGQQIESLKIDQNRDELLQIYGVIKLSNKFSLYGLKYKIICGRDKDKPSSLALAKAMKESKDILPF